MCSEKFLQEFMNFGASPSTFPVQSKRHGFFHAFVSDKAGDNQAGVAVVGGGFRAILATNKNQWCSLYSRNHYTADSGLHRGCEKPKTFPNTQVTCILITPYCALAIKFLQSF
jgi:hypothetical protein